MKHLRYTAIACAMAIFLVSSSASAHDGPHAGSSVEGTVVALVENALTVKTGSVEVEVMLSARTQILSASKTVGREALLPGVHVDVHGSKLPGGGLAAREVTIEGAPGAEAHPHHEP